MDMRRLTAELSAMEVALTLRSSRMQTQHLSNKLLRLVKSEGRMGALFGDQMLGVLDFLERFLTEYGARVREVFPEVNVEMLRWLFIYKL